MTVASASTSTLYFEQFYLGCLAHASYLLGSEGEAVSWIRNATSKSIWKLRSNTI